MVDRVHDRLVVDLTGLVLVRRVVARGVEARVLDLGPQALHGRDVGVASLVEIAEALPAAGARRVKGLVELDAPIEAEGDVDLDGLAGPLAGGEDLALLAQGTGVDRDLALQRGGIAHRALIGGHGIADRRQRRVAEAVLGELRPGDLVGALGGDQSQGVGETSSVALGAVETGDEMIEEILRGGFDRHGLGISADTLVGQHPDDRREGIDVAVEGFALGMHEDQTRDALVEVGQGPDEAGVAILGEGEGAIRLEGDLEGRDHRQPEGEDLVDKGRCVAGRERALGVDRVIPVAVLVAVETILETVDRGGRQLEAVRELAGAVEEQLGDRLAADLELALQRSTGRTRREGLGMIVGESRADVLLGAIDQRPEIRRVGGGVDVGVIEVVVPAGFLREGAEGRGEGGRERQQGEASAGPPRGANSRSQSLLHHLGEDSWLDRSPMQASARSSTSHASRSLGCPARPSGFGRDHIRKAPRFRVSTKR